MRTGHEVYTCMQALLLFLASRLAYIVIGLHVGRLRCLDRVLCTAARLFGHIPKTWPCLQLYAGCAPLDPPLTEDFVPYNFFSLAVPPGPRPSLSSRPLLHNHGDSELSLSPLY